VTEYREAAALLALGEAGRRPTRRCAEVSARIAEAKEGAIR
jgi:hypothetical protein